MTEADTEMHSIALEFSRTPGPRKRSEGKYSGEEFLPMLTQWFDSASQHEKTLLVDLDGAAGYATSFLEHAFGGLARSVGADDLLNRLRLKSDEEPDLIDEITGYINDTRK